MLNNFTPWYFLPLVIFLPFALLLQSPWNTVLLSILALIAVVWFGRYYLPHGPVTSSPGSTLSVLTFNIWGDNPRKPELEAWIRQVNADLVFLQEIPESYSRNELPTLRDLYPYQFAPTTEKEWWNSVTLSRYPIVEAQDLLFWDMGMPALHKVVIDMNGQLISAYNVHMVVPFSGLKSYGFNAIWTKALYYDNSEQKQKIGQLLDDVRADPNPPIIAGDFNMSCYTGPYRDLAKQLVDSFREAGKGFGLTWPVDQADSFFPVSIPALRIDYIWHGSGIRALEAHRKPPFGSDHLPLYAVLRIDGK